MPPHVRTSPFSGCRCPRLAALLALAALALAGLERAFLPFWYFLGDSRVELEALIPAGHWFALHVPPEEREQRAREIAERFPEVRVPRRPEP